LKKLVSASKQVLRQRPGDRKFNVLIVTLSSRINVDDAVVWCRRRRLDLTDAEQELGLHEMSAAAVGASSADVCDTYCASRTPRALQRCDTGPTKYTVTGDVDPDSVQAHALDCVHHFTTPCTMDTCSSGTPLTLKPSTALPNSLAATLTARYLDQ